MIRKGNVREKIKEIYNSVDKLLDHFEKDPKNLEISEKYIYYILDTTIKILDNYNNIFKFHQANNPEIKQMLEKSEESLDVIKKEIDRQIVNIVRDDVMNIESDIQALKNLIEMEDYR
jgi:5-bromo-4-chloroindolyl phosphate hydrolysis protein